MGITKQIKRPVRFVHHSFYFVREWMQNPRNIGAIAPSSSQLGRAMAKHIDLSHPGVVIELGGGTGSLTRTILERGVPPERLLVFEHNPKFASMLRKAFPDIQVIQQDARKLSVILKEMNITEVNTIISGIPLRSLPKPLLEELLQESLKALNKSSSFIQFTYGKRSPVPEKCLVDAKWRIKAVEKIWQNLPPATVWKYKKLS